MIERPSPEELQGGEIITNHHSNTGSLNVNYSFNEGRALKNHPLDDFSEGACLQHRRYDESLILYYYGARYYNLITADSNTS